MLSSFLQRSCGDAPQKEQLSPLSFKKGLLLAQVPENSPSFFAQIFMAIPAKPNPNNTAATKKTSISNNIYLRL